MRCFRPLPYLTLIAACMAAAGVGAAQARYVVAPGSTFALDGSTALGGFTCGTDRASGAAVVEQGGQVQALVLVPVETFDCGNGHMNRDLRGALHSDEHPAIRFVLTQAEADPQTGPDGWANVRAWGTLTLGGVERPIRIAAQGRREGAGVRLRGRLELRMTDFGIRPPSGPLGLIRARDAITVRFDVAARSDAP